MKYQSNYFGSKPDFAEFIKKTIPELFSGKLSIEGKTVSLPVDSDLDYKLKFSEDEGNSALTLKVSWNLSRGKKDDVDVDID